MAVITISDAGGNINATATWVGGVVPVAADTINATATSGTLVVNVAFSIRVLDLTNYTATLEMRNNLLCGVNLNFLGTAIILSSTMTITAPLGTIGRLGIFCGRGGAGFGNSIQTNGTLIPFFYIQPNQNQSIVTLLDDINCNTFIQLDQNANQLTNGFKINVTDWVGGGGGIGRFNGTTIVNLNGANCTWNVALNSYMPIGMPIQIDTPGTLTITNSIQVNPSANSGSSGITYIQGTLAGSKILEIQQPSITAPGGATTYRVDLNGVGTWDTVSIANNGRFQSTIELLSDLNFTNLYILPDGFADQNAIPPSPLRFPVRFTGATGALKGGEIYTNATQYINFPMSANLANSGGIQLNSGVTHTASYLSSIGGDETSFNRVFFRSITPGTKATLNLTGDQGVFYTNFTDIDASGGNTIYTFGGTASNSDNVETITSYVPTSAATFVN